MTETGSTSPNQPGNSTNMERTGTFVVSLLQAFLRTGYYRSEHPQAHKAKTGLYELFISIVGQNGEITFLVDDELNRKSISIEGVGDHPFRLQSIMLRGMAETYTPKFVQFLQRKELVALSLNARMNAEEFSHFVDIMSEPAYGDMNNVTVRERFVETLREHRIFNISFIFGEEFITSRHNVPWRTRMALSRLKKDIHLLPIFRKLDDYELHRIKLQILTDLLRPLASPELIYSFLLNLDLAVSPLLSEEDGERYVFILANDRLLLLLCAIFIEDSKAGGRFPEHVTTEKRGRLLAGICQRLNAIKDPQAGSLLETLFNTGMIPLEALSERIKVRVLTIKQVSTFLTKPEAVLEAVHKATEPDIYSMRAQTVISFVPFLFERGRYGEALSIVELINRHAHEQTARAACAIQIRAGLVFGDTLVLAAKIFLTASKETRTLIGRLFQLIGHGTIPHIQRILIESDDPWRSKQAAETLIAMGDKAVNGLLSALDSTIFSTISVAAVLRTICTLSESIHKKEIIRLLQKHCSSKTADIRREALAGLLRISPASGFTCFRVAAADPDLRVSKIALRGLGLAGDRRAVEILTGFVAAAEHSNKAADLERACVAIRALGALPDSCLAARPAVLTFLGTKVDRYCSGAWKIIIPGAFVPPTPLLISLTDSVAGLNGAAVRSHLLKLSRHHNADVASRAAELLG